MTEFIAKAFAERQLGLALHYPFLHAAVVGLGARRTLEFGAGGSTRVFLDALPDDGKHASMSMERRDDLAQRHGFDPACPGWFHFQGLSETCRRSGAEWGPLDLILHDGSHAADVVAEDIAWAWPHLKRFGLLLIHDSQHSYCGAEVRAGIARGLATAGAVQGSDYSTTTLPYGFGLTILRREEGGPGEVVPALAKASSPHRTALVEVRL